MQEIVFFPIDFYKATGKTLCTNAQIAEQKLWHIYALRKNSYCYGMYRRIISLSLITSLAMEPVTSRPA